MEEIIEYKGHIIEITRAQDYDNPRTDWDGHVGTMVCWHSRYKLGDEQPSEDITEWMEEMLDLDEELCDQKYDDCGDDLRRYHTEFLFPEFEKKYIFKILYLYDHSGITMSCASFEGRAPHASWDSGPVGIIYVEREDLVTNENFSWSKEYMDKYHPGKTKEQVAEYFLEAEVETYDQYLTGEVYAYNVDDYEGDSCSGYYGDEGIKQAIEEAKDSIDYQETKAVKNHAKKIKSWIKSKVPFIYRKPFQFSL